MSLERPNYFTGQFLKEADFLLEQEYHRVLNRLHNRNLHTSGVSDGLIVTHQAGTLGVTVSPGMAIDRSGRSIILSEGANLSFSGKTEGTYFIVISYTEAKTVETEETGVKGFTRVYEQPLLEILNGAPALDSDQLALARVILENAGSIAIKSVDNSARRLSGVSAGESLTIAKDLSVLGNTTQALRVQGDAYITGNVGIGTAAPGAKLDVAGDVKASNFVSGNSVYRDGSMELSAATPYIDFHFGESAADYNTRIINDAGGQLSVVASMLSVSGSILTNGALQVGTSGGTLNVGNGGNFAYRTNVLFANTTGNVGIGTATPGTKLDVVGEVKASNFVAGNSVYQDGSMELSAATPYIDFHFGESVADYDTRIINEASGSLSVKANIFSVIGKSSFAIDNSVENTSWIKFGDNAVDNKASAKIEFAGGGILHGGLRFIPRDTANSQGKFILSMGGNDDPDAQTSILAVQQNGNVGLGTVIPDAKLHVVGGAIMPAQGNSENAGILFPKDVFGGSGDRAWMRYYSRSGEAATLELGISNDVDDHIALMPSGNVGVGTATPGDKLDVAGSARLLTGTNPIRFTSGWSGFPDSTTNQAEISNDTGTYKTLMIIGNKSAGMGRRVSVWDRLEVNGDLLVTNNVGIGTVTPAAALTIAKAGGKESNPDSSMHITSDCILFGGSNNGLEANSAQFSAGKHVAGSLNIVGMGATWDVRKVDIWAEGGLTLHGNSNTFKIFTDYQKVIFTLATSYQGGSALRGISWDGDTNWDSYSDKKLKTDIKNEENILERLVKLNVKNFRWKDNPEREIKMIGFIAQDVKPLFPALVGENEDPETKETTLTLKYANFGVLAIGAIKELKLEYDKRIAALEKEIAGLKKK